MKIAAIILNFFFPGIGSLVIGKIGSGITQLLLYIIGWFFTFTLIGAILGLPMILVAWIWGLVTAATHQDQPVQVHVIHSNAVAPEALKG
jgi:TM2 domain-containing membrane protein YozV